MAYGFRNYAYIRVADIRAEGGMLRVPFTCPRCGRDQVTSLNQKELLGGKEIHCKDRAVCGNIRNMTMYFYGVNSGLTANPTAGGIEAGNDGRLRIVAPLTVRPAYIDWGDGSCQDSNDVPLNLPTMVAGSDATYRG